MINILITSMGGTGSNSVLEALKRTSLGPEIYCVGTHADKYELACSTADVNYLVPWVREGAPYIVEHLRLEVLEKIDLFIPNSDREVTIVAKHREQFKSKLLIPDLEVIQKVQDKFSLFRLLRSHGLPVAETYEIERLDTIEKQMKSLPNLGRFWLRVKRGEGSIAATWVKTAEQAMAWIKLWRELQGFEISDFLVSEFLPGKDYAVQIMWKQGRLLNAKICQRLTYYDGDQRLSGMASTPGVAKTVDNREAVQTCIDAVETISREFSSLPNGVYEFDMKENAEGVACVTEVNIGRFPMINSIFNVTGRYKPAELYVRAALDLDLDIPGDPYDSEPEILMIRGLDRKPKFCRAQEVDQLKRGVPIPKNIEQTRVGS